MIIKEFVFGMEKKKPSSCISYELSLFSEQDLYLFNEGTLLDVYNKLGAHIIGEGEVQGVYFALWAPNAKEVFLIGDFNDWQEKSYPLKPRGTSGIWEGFVPGLATGTLYKYLIVSQYGDYRVAKADPYGFLQERPPGTASIIWNLAYNWQDKNWMETRAKLNGFKAPISIYEVHLGSWLRDSQEGNRFLTYREIAPRLTDYVHSLGFSHVEFLPLMEHPFYGSWGYQITGYFSPTNRYGTPQDLMYLIDYLHQAGIGVILDWVPSHFATDEHGLYFFDGSHLYEHADPRKGFHPDWHSAIFNYGRNEVRSFLISNALFWLERYHADGLRLDAVASMLYLDYSRRPGEWIPNEYGGRENLEAIDFLRCLNVEVYKYFPDVQTYAEESTDWPMVSRPTYLGGLGFGMKWDMGWMHDTLSYFSRDPIYRKYHHNELTFRMLYAFSENFVLPFSHDEVVHGKGSLLGKMAGDDWQKFANLRLLLGYQFTQPGKKLLFMGGEIGQWREWDHESSLDWDLLACPLNQGLQHWVKDLNILYHQEAALHEMDFSPQGFRWVDCQDVTNSILSYLRLGELGQELLVVCNFTPVLRYNYRVGVPQAGIWLELLNSDALDYGGSGVGNLGRKETEEVPFHGLPFSLKLTLPPLGILIFKPEEKR